MLLIILILQGAAQVQNERSIRFTTESPINYVSSLSSMDEKNVPRPPYWSGWCLSPSSVEFWLHKDDRIHERLRYNKAAKGWKKEILYP